MKRFARICAPYLLAEQAAHKNGGKFEFSDM
jgi:hypothetical protein